MSFHDEYKAADSHTRQGLWLMVALFWIGVSVGVVLFMPIVGIIFGAAGTIVALNSKRWSEF